MARPDDAKYAETHEWVRATKGEATIGITDYAVHQLSDLVHIELPKVGDSVEQGSPFGEIESVKTVADLVSPVTGKIVAVNDKLADKLDVLHDAPFGDGWMIRVKVSDAAELDSLMDAKAYQEFIESSEKEAGGKTDEEVDDDDFV